VKLGHYTLRKSAKKRHYKYAGLTGIMVTGTLVVAMVTYVRVGILYGDHFPSTSLRLRLLSLRPYDKYPEYYFNPLDYECLWMKLDFPKCMLTAFHRGT